MGVDLTETLLELDDSRIRCRPLGHITGEHHRRSRGPAEHGSIGTFEREHGHVGIELLGEHDERTAVVARDHDEHDGAVEVDDCPPDLRAVFQLEFPHGFRGSVEAREVRQHDHRAIAGRRVDGPRHLLARPREQGAAGVGVGAVGGWESLARHRLGLDADDRR